MSDVIHNFLRSLFYRILINPYRRFQYFRSEVVIKKKAGSMEVFRDIYNKKLWRSAESVSGTGSTFSGTSQIRSTLPALFGKYGIRKVLDLPCGDFNWMKDVYLGGVEYVGADLIDDLTQKNKKYETSSIKFTTLNLVEDSLPECDLILVRDCLVHFSYGDIHKAILNIKRSRSTYLLTTSFSNHKDNCDIDTGFWRPINLLESPFCFPVPMEVLDDFGQGSYKDKSLLLWRIKDLPNGGS